MLFRSILDRDEPGPESERTVDSCCGCLLLSRLSVDASRETFEATTRPEMCACLWDLSLVGGYDDHPSSEVCICILMVAACPPNLWPFRLAASGTGQVRPEGMYSLFPRCLLDGRGPRGERDARRARDSLASSCLGCPVASANRLPDSLSVLEGPAWPFVADLGRAPRLWVIGSLSGGSETTSEITVAVSQRFSSRTRTSAPSAILSGYIASTILHFVS